MNGLIVDLFAGGGGASLGMSWALGREPDIAINHDPVAIAMHQANHPNTVHYCQSVWAVEPIHVTGGRPVSILWASPDCKHFSKAKGGKPKCQNIRDLAWVVIKWAKQVRPTLIMLENVEEFTEWGPLGPDKRPIENLKGTTFRAWRRQLQKLGYRVQHRELRACDYGAPTIRKRMFLIARRDDLPIVWPVPTHGPGRAHPYRTAAECIDWSIPCPSIFERVRPLAENTLKRIALEHKAQVEMRYMDVRPATCWERREPCGFPRQVFARKLLEWRRHRSEILGMAHEVRLLPPDAPWACERETLSGVALIAAERRRQVAGEGFSDEYDDTRQDSELAWAACYYAMPCPLHVSGCGLVTPSDIFDETGFDTQWAKRDNKSRVRQLAVAGALIAAEIDRLQRADLDYGGKQAGHETEASA